MTDPSRRRLLRAISRAAQAPTVTELVAAVGGHPNTTRHHLRVLAGAGLVSEEEGRPAGGRGRPAVRYAVTRAGHEALDAAPGGSAAQEYVALAAAFAERLAERDGDPGADSRAIGRAWGTGLAARHRADQGEVHDRPVGRVVGLLDRLGFSPEVEPVPDPGSGRTVLLRTCPLLDAARRHPDVVCQVHLGLVAGALEADDQSADGLRLQPFARPGACELALPPTLVS
ncbi:MAG: helix-turn-helix transcriptional regulator [Ornithinibacter sp.]